MITLEGMVLKLHRAWCWLLLLAVVAVPCVAARCQAQCGAGSVLASQKRGMPGMPHCHMAQSKGPAWQTTQPCGGTMHTDDAVQAEAKVHHESAIAIAAIAEPVPVLTASTLEVRVQVLERPPALARLQSILRI